MRSSDGAAELDLEQGFELAGYRVQPSLNLIEGPRGERRVEPKVMAVLVCLARQAGSLVRHDELILEAWGPRGATADLLSRAVGKLRRAFEDEPSAGGPIETIRKRGYRLTAPVGPMPARSRPATRPRRYTGWLRPWISPVLASGSTLAAVAGWLVFLCT